MTNGQKSGLCHFSSQHAAIGIVMDGNLRYLEYRVNGKIKRGPAIEAKYIWLKSKWGMDGISHFSYSLDGEQYIPYGDPYQMVWGNYRGDRLGIYCFNDHQESGFIDVDYFHYK